MGPLAEFVRMAEANKLPRGSVLIVEALDRLTREQCRIATTFILQILNAGVSIATTTPEHIFLHDNYNDMTDILIIVVLLSRGHEESATKSKRVGEAWAEKRKNAAVKKLTAMCPAWLKLREDRSGFDEIKDHADTVRRIFRMATDGYGIFRICRALNTEKVPTFGRESRKGRQWYESYVTRILHNRSVMGEYQPCRRDGYKSIPAGDPIKNYYPPVVTEAEFIAARRAIDSRQVGYKRTGKDVPNIFGKLIKNARDGMGWLYIPAKKKSPIARLEPVGGRGGSSVPLSIRYADLEGAFLRFLREVSAADLTDKPKPNKAADLEWKIGDLKARVGVLEGRKRTARVEELNSLCDTINEWKGELAQLEKELESEKHPTDAGAILADATGVIDLLATDPEHYRTKLKQLLHLLVAEMWLLVFEFQRKGSRDRTMTDRAAVLQVHFKSGHFRSILLGRSNRDGHAPYLPLCGWTTQTRGGAWAREGGTIIADLRTFRKEGGDLVKLLGEELEKEFRELPC
jgi:DNA invertase Pin-like site-specific DNA recombinase